MKKPHTRYTQEEKEIILEELSLHPQNISVGLEIAADRIGRPYKTVKAYWYNALKKKSNNTAFLTIGKTRYAINSKNIYSSKLNTGVTNNSNLFQKIIRWIKNKTN